MIAPGVQYIWKNWSDSGAVTHTVTILSDTTFTVNFGLQYQFTANIVPSIGGTVNPASGTFFDAGDTASILAVAAPHFAFLNWSGDASGSVNPAILVMSSPKSLNAMFDSARQVTVAADSVGRSVVIDDSVYSAPQVVYWLPGSHHTIGTPSPQAGASGIRYSWKRWSDSGAVTHSVSTTKDTTFTAYYQTQYLLTMTSRSGGSVTPLTSWLPKDTVILLHANPDTGYSFFDWTGTGLGSYSGTLNPVSITLSRPMNEVARFGRTLPPPQLVGVANNMTGASATPLLQWKSYAGATSYTLQIATDSLFSALVYQNTNL